MKEGCRGPLFQVQGSTVYGGSSMHELCFLQRVADRIYVCKYLGCVYMDGEFEHSSVIMYA